MRFSFCTTCSNRRADLERVLGPNLVLLKDAEELVLLDYNSLDGLRQWVLKNFKPCLKSGRLRIFSERLAPRFFMSHAKNVSHLLGDGSVLINLDADNFLDDAYLTVLRGMDWKRHVMLYPFKGSGGFKGRIAVRADVFRGFGGYDEEMNLGYGYEEIDLFRRIFAAGRSVRFLSLEKLNCLPTDAAHKATGQKSPEINISDSTHAHHALSDRNLAMGRLRANVGRDWGMATVWDVDENNLRVGCRGQRRDLEEPIEVDTTSLAATMEFDSGR